MGGRKKYPLELKRRRVTLRLSPFLIDIVTEYEINIGAELEEHLLRKYAHLVDIDDELYELADQYGVELPRNNQLPKPDTLPE